MTFLGIRLEFWLFGLTLLGVALWHRHTLRTAVTGLAVILVYTLGFTDVHLASHLRHEGQGLLNLFGLLMGFALLARHFAASRVPDALPHWLPKGAWGSWALLWIVFVLSSFLDNIAAAMIGGTIALVVYRGHVHIGYLAALVAASNAGGAGSVVGDTTTTMMWIDGVSACDVLHAYVGAIAALLVCGAFAATQQHRLQPLAADGERPPALDIGHLGVVVLILVGAILANIFLELPAVGVWAAILLGAPFRKTEWGELKHAAQGSAFLLSLVLCASLMPVEELPSASWQTALGLGFVSAVFDNIPLTKLALVQGGYDWGFLAYAVGYGGSMIWFGSSAGVALSHLFPQAKSVGAWLRHGWHVALGYTLGFALLLWIVGWHPHAPHKTTPEAIPAMPALDAAIPDRH